MSQEPKILYVTAQSGFTIDDFDAVIAALKSIQIGGISFQVNGQITFTSTDPTPTPTPPP